MVGNLGPDNSGRIYVEFDENNLIVVDPNKTIDASGNIRERLIDHENLVMFANLEADVLPRTKLAVGISPEDSGIRTVSVAKMNFLKPTKNSYLGTGYYDEMTGSNTTKFDGTNQPAELGRQSSNGSKPYIENTVANELNIMDNGLLGINDISITTNSSFIPSVTIKLEDIQGRALFQLGENSPYAAFFNLPYPPFYLTIKGYYGQAIRYQLNLESFNAAFNSYSGNYQVTLTFRGYKFNILNEVAMGHLLATPHMYSQRFNFGTTPVTPQQPNKSVESQSKTQAAIGANNSNSSNEFVTELVTERGYQKIVEVYSEYKAKKLIPDDLPELTLIQLMTKLDQFEQQITLSFNKVDVAALTNIRNYKGILLQYFTNIRSSNSSWFNTFLNPQPLILLNNSEKIYTFRNIGEDKKTDAISNLKSRIKEYNDALAKNPTLGSTGVAPIPNPIRYELMVYDGPMDIDWKATTTAQTGVLEPTTETIERIKNSYSFVKIINETNVNGKPSYTENVEPFFIFEGNDKFDSTISLLDTQSNKKLSDFESKITADLLRKIEDKDLGIGFKPTVSNIIAVIMASAEAFIRLLDEVHTKAWAVKYDPIRKNAILNNPSSAQSSETKNYVPRRQGSVIGNTEDENSQIPVYPWPQFFEESIVDKKGKFQLKYIADPSVVGQTQGNNYSKWPEVEFVEEFLKGLTQKFQNPIAPQPLDNQRDTNLININAIEFPSLGIAYSNKEEVKFFYEIWERQFLTSHYSGLVRANLNQINELINLNIETEVNNVRDSLGVSSPYITFKLKNYGLNSSNYEVFLNNISNMGTGRSYQNYIRDFFVTPYIRNITENSFSILNTDNIGKIPQITTKSDALRMLISNASNTPLVVDTLPYTDTTWCSSNLNQSASATGNQVYETKETLTIFEPRKIIANFNDISNHTVNRPVTNFSYLKTNNPTLTAGDSNLAGFYLVRTPLNFIATEGYCDSVTPTRLLPVRTTTSMLNTPYFINAIQSGVDSFKKNETYPYVSAAYLFLNSLPLATLREKYKTVTGDIPKDLNYISSCFKKFGAIHKMPYAWVLRYGSIWHRYKKHKETGVDILTNVWKDFDYSLNYNPITNDPSTQYTFKYGNVNRNVVLQSETDTDIKMEVGFYPKLINDFNIFYNGYDLYNTYTNDEIQQSVNAGMKMYDFSTSSIVAKQENKNLRLITWSVLIPDLVPQDGVDCNPKNNTKPVNYFVVPSFGTELNQTINSCFTGTTTSLGSVVPITSNRSVFNGSVRSLWSAPNYGYFDSTQIAFPNPDSYLTSINTGNTQSPLYFLNTDRYSKIEEVFSVFEKKILDSFEQEFLNFCKPITATKGESQTVTYGQNPVNMNDGLRNFQSVFGTLMTVPPQTNEPSETEYFESVINKQYDVFQMGIKTFMEYDIILRYGNPSNYNRRVFGSYLSFNGPSELTDPITFNPYVQGSLPTKGGKVTLTQSKQANRRAWTALETEVGFSTIRNVAYSSNGSYITDFFVENNIEFTEQNVVLLAQIIKMFATQKLNQPTISVSQFKNQITQYLNLELGLQNNFLNGVLTGLNKALPSQQQLPQQSAQSVLSGEQSKVESYEVFKALNDKWVAGGDYTNKTLFEDIMFLDRASRNIGDTLLIDIFELKNMFNEKSLNQAMSVFTFISSILIKNNFNVMNLPAYVNFYGIQDVDGTTTPTSEGSLDFADSLWGTYLDVDYRKSSPKMVCFYAGKPSQYLDVQNNSFKFRNDGFDMNRGAGNPLLEDFKNKNDYSRSNKCVGFTVDIGIRSQNVFYSFNVSQENGLATSETINTVLDIANQASGRQIATQNNSLYNLYKERSYKCSVSSLGNALIQPAMYFNLKHVPMFYGAYMIQEVQHNISSGNFQTTFTGVRQGQFDLPSIDTLLQSINDNLLTKLEEILEINKGVVTVSATTNNVKSTQIPQKADNSLDATNACTLNVLKTYNDSGFGDGVVGTLTQKTPQDLVDVLTKEIPNNKDLQLIIYCLSYMRSFQKDSSKDGKFNAWNNNLGMISLDTDYQGLNTTLVKRYSCVKSVSTKTTTNSLPIVHFETLESYVRFMSSLLGGARLKQIQEIGLAKYYVCFWPMGNGVSPQYYDSNIRSFDQVTETFYSALDSAMKAKLISIDANKNYKFVINVNAKKVPSSIPGTPTPTPTSGSSAAQRASILGLECPPPSITRITPLTGYTGTIVQISGTSLATTSSIKIIGVEVPRKDITILNDSLVSFIVPKVLTGNVSVNGRIEIKTDHGSATSTRLFNYSPTLGTNTNPQNNGPLTLFGTSVPLNESKTQSLNVKVNPQNTGWVISQGVNMNYTVYELEEINNVINRKYISKGEVLVEGQVVNNQFNITLEQVELLLKNNIPKNEGKTQIDIVFIVSASKIQQQPVVQQFPFKVWYTTPNQTQVPVDNVPTTQTKITFPPKQLSIVTVGESPTMQGAGLTYYNIRKPAGGFITLNFTVPQGEDYNDSWRASSMIIDASTFSPVPNSMVAGVGTNYTNDVTVRSLGTFKLQIEYIPYGFTSPSNGEILRQTILSDIFTL